MIQYYQTRLQDFKDLQNEVTTLGGQTFLLYHTYEEYVPKNDQSLQPEPYISPNEILYLCDPVRHIITYLSNNQPTLYLDLNRGGEEALPTDKTLGNITLDRFVISFWLNRKGQILLFPEFYYPPDYIEFLLVADALGEMP